jgi:cell division protein FtsB
MNEFEQNIAFALGAKELTILKMQEELNAMRKENEELKQQMESLKESIEGAKSEE